MADYGTKISPVSTNVLSAVGSDLVYSSRWSNFKLHSVITKTVSIPDGDTGAFDLVDNPIPYAPMHLPFCESTTTIPGKWRFGTMAGTLFMPDDLDWASVGVRYRPAPDNDFLLFVSHFGAGIRTFTFKIAIFVDSPQSAGAAIPSVGDFGTKTAGPGLNVLTALDYQLAMTSKYQSLTVATDTSVTAVAPSTQATYAHGLGYVPIFLPYIRVGSVAYPIPSNFEDHSVIHHAEGWISNTTLYVDSACDGSTSHTFDFLIFNERLV